MIEDNEADVFLVEEAMAAHGIQADLQVIRDGEDAMRWVEQGNRADRAPNLFILDLNLPKRSGNEILACIRENAEFAHIPVLIMTSSDSEKDRQETTRLGSSGYFLKPNGFQEFLEIGAVIKRLIAAENREA